MEGEEGEAKIVSRGAHSTASKWGRGVICDVEISVAVDLALSLVDRGRETWLQNNHTQSMSI